MRIYKPRGLNINESYACRRTAVRSCFEKLDLDVLWGAKRSFEFDDKMRSRPKLQGCIVASLSVNHRIRPVQPGVLNFYIICDKEYGAEQKQAFENTVLTRMHKWYLSHIEATPRGGADELFVEWSGQAFRLFEIHFP